MTSLTDIKEKAVDKKLSELSEEIREIKMIGRKNEHKFEVLEKLNLTSVSLNKNRGEPEGHKGLSSLFKNKVYVLVSDVQKSSVQDTRQA